MTKTPLETQPVTLGSKNVPELRNYYLARLSLCKWPKVELWFESSLPSSATLLWVSRLSIKVTSRFYNDVPTKLGLYNGRALKLLLIVPVTTFTVLTQKQPARKCFQAQTTNKALSYYISITKRKYNTHYFNISLSRMPIKFF